MRALALVLVAKALVSYADFVTSMNLALLLSEHLGYSDTQAAALIGAWGVATSVFGVALGRLVDELQPRRALLIGGALALVGRSLVAAAHSRPLLVFGLLGPLALSEALAIPVLAIVVRRASTPEHAPVAFSYFYAAAQAGAIVAGLVTDEVRARSHVHEPLGVLVATPIATTLVYLAAVAALPPLTPPPTTKAAGTRTCVEEARTVVREPNFWRLVLFVCALSGTSMVWQHVNVALPKFLVRTLGTHARYGDVSAINPTLVLFTVVPVQAALARLNAFDVIAVGTAAVAAAPLVLALGPLSYTTDVAFMCALSVGEVVYSSRVYDVMLRAAPLGREGVYSALAGVPMLVVRAPAALLSGALLEAYCPRAHAPRCARMWFVVAALAATTPLVLVLARAAHVLPRAAPAVAVVGIVEQALAAPTTRRAKPA